MSYLADHTGYSVTAREKNIDIFYVLRYHYSRRIQYVRMYGLTD